VLIRRPSGETKNEPLPYGIKDLEPAVREQKTTGKVKCVVRHCTHWLVPPSRKEKGEACPDHGLRVHRGATYSYADYRRNLTVADAAYFQRHIHRHPFKWETHRFGQERSEDAVTWNVFRSLQQASCLKEVAALCTGLQIPQEPRLFLWGLELQEDRVTPWNLLLEARERFESDLPEGQPKTEPDIALFLPRHYLVLIEAKFTSINGTYERDKKTKLFDLTIDQLVRIYQDPCLRILDYGLAGKRDSIHYQLWRNMTFAEYMAGRDTPTTKAFHANLVRKGYEEHACGAFLTLVRPDYHDRFEQITWEDIYAEVVCGNPTLDRLGQYLQQKTAGLQPAFRITDGRMTEPNKEDPHE